MSTLALSTSGGQYTPRGVDAAENWNEEAECLEVAVEMSHYGRRLHMNHLLQGRAVGIWGGEARPG